MDENKDTQEVGATTEQHPPVEQSPAERDTQPLASPVPGAQSAESDIKNESNPNTE